MPYRILEEYHPDLTTTADIIKKPVTIDNFVSAVNTSLAEALRRLDDRRHK
jgi:hypothetical protein